jgi:DNA-binding CsgD family transcriptional regulator
MLLMVAAVSLAGTAISVARKDALRDRSPVLVAGMATAGMILGLVLVRGSYSDVLSYFLQGFIWLAVNAPVLTVLAISVRRTRFSAESQGAPASRLEDVGTRCGLTEREREIIDLLYRGRLNREIAWELHISTDTVKKHLYNVFRKTGVRNRIQLFRLVSGEESSPAIIRNHSGT